MSVWEKIYNFVFYRMESAPPLYGVFHLVFVALTAALIFFSVKYFLKSDEKTIRKFVFILWIILVAFELYKQINYSFGFEDGVLKFDFQWYAFPFQLCSTPLYTLGLIAFLPDCKVREALISFSATYALFGGLAVMIYPGDVFVKTLGISIQTMVHHGIQCAIGIFFAIRFIYNGTKTKKRFFIESAIAFSAFVAIAVTADVAVHLALLANGNDETFNMFYISPYHDSTLPVLSLFNFLPYPLFLLVYILGFSAAAFIVFMIQLSIYKLVLKIKESKKA